MIERALAIPGYMSEPELRTLAAWAGRHKRIVELGSFFGRSTRALADGAHEDARILAVDDFGGLREHGLENPTAREIRETFLFNLSDHLMSGKVALLESKHDVWAVECDMCFIDGSHDYESVRRDIANYYPVTNSLLCGHDFDDAHPDVQRAVMEFPDFQVVPGTSLWWVNP